MAAKAAHDPQMADRYRVVPKMKNKVMAGYVDVPPAPLDAQIHRSFTERGPGET